MTKAVATKDKNTNSITPQSLNKWNTWLAGLHALQGVVILLLSKTHVFPVQTSYLTNDPSASEVAGHKVMNLATRHLFDLNIAYVIAAFFFVTAIMHAVVGWWLRNRYEADLKKKVNRFRWIDYSISGGLMMIAIAVLSGVADLSTLIAIFALDAVMCLLGLAMEFYNQGKAKPNWLAYWAGLGAGAVPWIVVLLYAWGANWFGDSNVPGYVYGIYATMLVLTVGIGANMYKGYKKTGAWQDYLYTERNYVILTTAAKTLLAWQIFAGILHP